MGPRHYPCRAIFDWISAGRTREVMSGQFGKTQKWSEPQKFYPLRARFGPYRRVGPIGSMGGPLDSALCRSRAKYFPEQRHRTNTGIDHGSSPVRGQSEFEPSHVGIWLSLI